MNEETIGLYCQKNGSDKEYHVDLFKSGDGWKVNGRNGRRGGTLKTQEKITVPVSYEVAKKEYDRLVASKLKDSYTIGENGVPYQDTPAGDLYTGILPQLLNTVDESQMESLFKDPAWCMEEKFDGDRRSESNIGGEWFGINKKGMRVALPMPIVEALSASPEGMEIDAEIIGNVLHVFDLMSHEGKDVRGSTYSHRYSLLEAFTDAMNSPCIRLVKAYRTEAEKRASFRAIKEAKGEGVVFKRWDSFYVSGRPNSGGDQLKFKFIESATLLVASHSNAKRSVQVVAFDEGNNKIPLGSVTIPPNYKDLPEVGAIVEIGYLYAYPNGCIFQPVYRGKRADQNLEDCVTSQLKYKPLSQAA